jgi:hypothetical protein
MSPSFGDGMGRSNTGERILRSIEEPAGTVKQERERQRLREAALFFLLGDDRQTRFLERHL